ncbi:MAG TPA: hypothetical protein VIP82_02865 [Microbacterium sp.]|uniref:hypothetical protein n=1 Tax=Microbacterium sp. TaxID=51671 RepID=UPI002F940ED7
MTELARFDPYDRGVLNPEGLLRPPVPVGRVVGWAIVSALAACCAGLLVLWAAQIAAGSMGELIESTPVVMPWILSLYFAVAGVVGGAVCLAYSGRVYEPRRARIAAFTTSAVALGVSIAALMVGVLVVIL